MKALIFFVLGVLFPYTQAEAMAVTKSFTFHAENFAPAGAPTSTVNGSFDFTYDDTLSLLNDIAPNSISLTINATTFNTGNTRVDIQLFENAGYEIVLGGLTGENQEIFPGIPNDFILRFKVIGGEMVERSFQYTDARPGIYNAQITSVIDTTTLTPHPVPIPSIPLVGLAIGIAFIGIRNISHTRKTA